MNAFTIVLRRYGLLLLVLAAVASVGLGWLEALNNSRDFQWSPSKMMWAGRNPYEAYLSGDTKEIIMDQAPNYAHLLYIVLLPIAMMAWPTAKLAWACANLAFLAYVVWGVQRMLPTPEQRHWWWGAVALACIGHPIKLTLGNGQHALLCMAAVMFIWQNRTRPLWQGLGLAVLMSKYTFGVFVALALLVTGAWSAVAVAAALSIGAWLFFAGWTHTPIWTTLLDPLLVAQRDVPKGGFDFYSMFRLLAERHLVPMGLGAAVLVGINAWVYAALWRVRQQVQRDDSALGCALAAAVMMSLGTMYHLGYDQTVELLWCGALLAVHVQGGQRLWGIVGMFIVFWTIPRIGRFFPVEANPLNTPAAMAAFGLIAVAYARWAVALIARNAETSPTPAPAP